MATFVHMGGDWGEVEDKGPLKCSPVWIQTQVTELCGQQHYQLGHGDVPPTTNAVQ